MRLSCRCRAGGNALQPTQTLLIAIRYLAATNVAISLVQVLQAICSCCLSRRALGIFMGYYGTVWFLKRLPRNVQADPAPCMGAAGAVRRSSLATLFDVQRGQAYLYLNNLKFS